MGMIMMPLIATLAAGLTPQAKNLIRRFAEQGAYTAGQTTALRAPKRRRLVADLDNFKAAQKVALDKAVTEIKTAQQAALKIKTAQQAALKIKTAQQAVLNKSIKP